MPIQRGAESTKAGNLAELVLDQLPREVGGRGRIGLFLQVGGRRIQQGKVIVHRDGQGLNFYAPFMGQSDAKLSMHASGQMHVQRNSDAQASRRIIDPQLPTLGLQGWMQRIWGKPHGDQFMFMQSPPGLDCIEVAEDPAEITIHLERALSLAKQPEWVPFQRLPQLIRTKGTHGCVIINDRTRDILVGVEGALPMCIPFAGNKRGKLVNDPYWRGLWEPIVGVWREWTDNLEDGLVPHLLKANDMTEHEWRQYLVDYELVGADTRLRLGIGPDGHGR